MKECCWENLEKAERKGRASYVCPVCKADVSLALILLVDCQESLDEVKTE